MKEMIKKVREEKGGFTIAELLIVVAIVAVLVAIAIPVFTSSLNDATAGTDQANARSLYGDIQAKYLSSSDKDREAAAFTKVIKDTYGITVDAKTDTFKFSDGQSVDMNEKNGVTVTLTDNGVHVKFEDGLTGKRNSDWGAKTA